MLAGTPGPVQVGLYAGGKPCTGPGGTARWREGLHGYRRISTLVGSTARVKMAQYAGGKPCTGPDGTAR